MIRLRPPFRPADRPFHDKASERKGVLAVIRAALRKHKCADVTGNGRYRVQHAVGAALGKHYQRRTNKHAGNPMITLVLKKTS